MSSASRSFARRATNSRVANNFATIAKQASTDVVGNIGNPAWDDDEFMRLACDLDGFGLIDGSVSDSEFDHFPELNLDVPSPRAVESPAPTSVNAGPGCMAPAPAPSASGFCLGSDAFGFPAFSDFLASPAPAPLTAPAPLSNASRAVKVKREDRRPGSTVPVDAKPVNIESLKKAKDSLNAPPRSVGRHIGGEEILDENDDEREFDAAIAAASSRGDVAALRKIKNSREKVRRAKMFNNFEELNEVLNITNKMMALSTTGSATPMAMAAAAVQAQEESDIASAKIKAASGKASTKKPKFKRAQVLRRAVTTVKLLLSQLATSSQANADLADQLQQLQQQQQQSSSASSFTPI